MSEGKKPRRPPLPSRLSSKKKKAAKSSGFSISFSAHGSDEDSSDGESLGISRTTPAAKGGAASSPPGQTSSLKPVSEIGSKEGSSRSPSTQSQRLDSSVTDGALASSVRRELASGSSKSPPERLATPPSRPAAPPSKAVGNASPALSGRPSAGKTASGGSDIETQRPARPSEPPRLAATRISDKSTTNTGGDIEPQRPARPSEPPRLAATGISDKSTTSASVGTAVTSPSTAYPAATQAITDTAKQCTVLGSGPRVEGDSHAAPGSGFSSGDVTNQEDDVVTSSGSGLAEGGGGSTASTLGGGSGGGSDITSVVESRAPADSAPAPPPEAVFAQSCEYVGSAPPSTPAACAPAHQSRMDLKEDEQQQQQQQHQYPQQPASSDADDDDDDESLFRSSVASTYADDHPQHRSAVARASPSLADQDTRHTSPLAAGGKGSDDDAWHPLKATATTATRASSSTPVDQLPAEIPQAETASAAAGAVGTAAGSTVSAVSVGVADAQATPRCDLSSQNITTTATAADVSGSGVAHGDSGSGRDTPSPPTATVAAATARTASVVQRSSRASPSSSVFCMPPPRPLSSLSVASTASASSTAGGGDNAQSRSSSASPQPTPGRASAGTSTGGTSHPSPASLDAQSHVTTTTTPVSSSSTPMSLDNDLLAAILPIPGDRVFRKHVFFSALMFFFLASGPGSFTLGLVFGAFAMTLVGCLLLQRLVRSGGGNEALPCERSHDNSFMFNSTPLPFDEEERLDAMLPHMQPPDFLEEMWSITYNYEGPATHHPSRTAKTYLRLEGSELEINTIREDSVSWKKGDSSDEDSDSDFQHRRPRRALFANSRTVNLLDSVVRLVPDNLNKRQRWSKKFPIRLTLSAARQQEASASSATSSSLPGQPRRVRKSAGGPNPYEHTVMFLFAARSRDKMQWFYRMQMAADPTRALPAVPNLPQEYSDYLSYIVHLLRDLDLPNTEKTGAGSVSGSSSVAGISSHTGSRKPVSAGTAAPKRPDYTPSHHVRQRSTGSASSIGSSLAGSLSLTSLEDDRRLESTTTTTASTTASAAGGSRGGSAASSRQSSPERQQQQQQSGSPGLRPRRPPAPARSPRASHRDHQPISEAATGHRSSMPLTERYPFGSLLWFNSGLGRLFYDAWREPRFADKLKVRWQRKLTRIKLPPFVQTLEMKELNLGHSLPVVQRVYQPQVDGRGLWLDVLLSYKGSFQVTIGTGLDFTGQSAAESSQPSSETMTSSPPPSGGGDIDTSTRSASPIPAASHSFSPSSAASLNATAATATAAASQASDDGCDSSASVHAHSGVKDSRAMSSELVDSAEHMMYSTTTATAAIATGAGVASGGGGGVGATRQQDMSAAVAASLARRRRRRQRRRQTMRNDSDRSDIDSGDDGEVSIIGELAKKLNPILRDSLQGSSPSPSSKSGATVSASSVISAGQHINTGHESTPATGTATDTKESSATPSPSHQPEVTMEEDDGARSRETAEDPPSSSEHPAAQDQTDTPSQSSSSSSSSSSFVSAVVQSLLQSVLVKRLKEKVSSIPVGLLVHVEAFEGLITVNVPPPPTNVIWFGFRYEPQLKISVMPYIGEQQVGISQLNKLIEDKIVEEVMKRLVLPNMEDLVIPLLSSGMDDDSSSQQQEQQPQPPPSKSASNTGSGASEGERTSASFA